jgi:asparagine synthase (glutamine-hydrolysing)
MFTYSHLFRSLGEKLMCGISGILNNQRAGYNNLRSMTDLISHRGPDDEGYFILDNQYKVHCAGGSDTPELVWNSKLEYSPIEKIEPISELPFKLAFGHRRLSIIDLSPAGHQPMSIADGRFWITFNGEIYNYQEIRTELEQLNYCFTTRTDTEVILASYCEWGKDCLSKFVGMWAFAIFDRAKNEIFLSRDRYGIKPLYYWFSPEGAFCFASEIKQFTVLPGWEPRMNSQRAYDYLVYSFTDHTDETMFAGVYQIPGGHYFKGNINSVEPVSGRKIIPQKWYNPKYSRFNGVFEDASSEFNRLFRNAVDLHLRADVTVGSALSGGLDSSAIVCEVNNILRNKGVQHLQKTFSACSIDERYDEKRWIDIVVGHTSVDAYFVYPRYEDIFDLISRLTWYHDEPFQSLSPYMAYNVFQSAAKNGVKVLLNGQGADEYLGGYGQFALPRYSNLFWEMHWKSLIRDVEKTREYKTVSYSGIIQNILSSAMPDFLRKQLGNWFGYSSRIKNLIDNKSLKVLPLHPFDIIPMKLGTVPEISNHMTFFSPLPKYLKWEDRNSMANSVEARVPFLDHRLVEFSYNLPDDYLDFQGETKRVLREGLFDILPPKIRARKDKNGYLTPEERWVKEDDPNLFRLKLKEAIEISDGIIKPDALRFFDDVVTGKVPFDYTYWRLIQFAEWMSVFGLKK